MNIILTNYLDLLLPFCLLLPFVAALIPFLFSYTPKLRDFTTFLITLLLVFNVVILIYFYTHNGALSYKMSSIMGMPIAFSIEPLGLTFALMASFLWATTTVYASGYIRVQDSLNNIEINKDLRPTFFFAFIALSLGFTIGIAFSGNLLTMFICYELLTLSTYPLIAGSGTQHARRAGKKYLYILLGSSVIFFLPAIIATSHFAGSIDFEQGGIIHGKIGPIGIAILFFCFVYGSAKSALMPLHSWLPSAMVAPVPVSAILHAVAVVKSGIFVILKVIVYVFGLKSLAELASHSWWIRDWFMIAASATIIFASVMALRQKSLKKLLAYSTISQLSYILLAASIMTPKGIIAATLHMVFHGVSKITLFFVAGAIYTSTKKTEISQMSGVGKIMPLSMVAFTICALSMIGIPPTACFFSKYQIFTAVWGNSNDYIIIGTLIISTTLSAAYFLPVIYKAFWGDLDRAEWEYKKPPAAMLYPLLFTALITLLILPFSGYIIDFIEKILF